MAEEQETVALESKATPEAQKAAEALGWIPPERFRGDPERFVDADLYIKRGEEILPIVKQQLRETRAELESVRVAQQQTAAALKEAQAALVDIEERNTVETQRKVDEAKASVKAALAKANEAGDHEAVAELTEQMVELRDAPPPKPPAKPAVEEAKPTPPSPELIAWKADNPWFEVDRRRTAYALGVAEDLRAAGETAKGREFFDKVSAEVTKFFDGVRERPADDKVEGSRGGANSERASGKKSFSSLPADAKAACQAETRNFVGPTKKYKTADEWHAAYAKIYFEGN